MDKDKKIKFLQRSEVPFLKQDKAHLEKRLQELQKEVDSLDLLLYLSAATGIPWPENVREGEVPLFFEKKVLSDGNVKI